MHRPTTYRPLLTKLTKEVQRKITLSTSVFENIFVKTRMVSTKANMQLSDTNILEGFPEYVVVKDKARLGEKIGAIGREGMNTLQVIADFDMTLTKFQVNGKRGQSCHSLITTENEEVNKRRTQLYLKYYPLEIDPSIPNDVKLMYMEEWWNASHSLIIEGGVSFGDIQKSVSLANISLREQTEQLFGLLNENRVPVLVFSAGIADVIEEVLKQKLSAEFENVRVVSNRMDFNESGKLVGFKGKLIHVLNKNEHALELAEAEGNGTGGTQGLDLEGRDNVILLGDHLGDLRMSDGVVYRNRITVGFLNDNVEQQVEAYKSAFDLVILRDGGMDTVLKLLELIASKKTIN